MAKTLVDVHSLGTGRTPQEVKDLRESSFELHQELGFPVIHKHRWNEVDLREGRAQQCPLHDELYDRAPQNCPYCFGTGYVGGYSDGTIVYVTLQDTPQDTIKILPTGTLQMDQHPQMTAPWIPEMGDGDMIILADFEMGSWEIEDVHERYVLRQVNPITIRGPGWGRQQATTKSRFRISQEAAADKLPYGHELYNVPIVFDYNTVPPDIIPPDDDEPLEIGTYTSMKVGVRIIGMETDERDSSIERNVNVEVAGDRTSISRGVRIIGKGRGTVINNI
jgi:hypothetical protein